MHQCLSIALKHMQMDIMQRLIMEERDNLSATLSAGRQKSGYLYF